MYKVESYSTIASMENDLNSKAKIFEPIAFIEGDKYYTVIYRKINKQ